MTELQPDDPRIGHPERTFTNESKTEVADTIRADYQQWARRTGRPKLKTSRTDAMTAWHLVTTGQSTPKLLGWPDLAAIVAAGGGHHPDNEGDTRE